MTDISVALINELLATCAIEIKYKTYLCAGLANVSVTKPLVVEKRGINSTASASKTCWSTFPAMLKYKKDHR